MSFASAMSEHPLTAHAMGEVTGSVLEQIGDRPDFAFTVVTAPHAGALEDAVRTVDEVLHPLVSIGCAAESVLGPHREVEQYGGGVAARRAHGAHRPCGTGRGARPRRQRTRPPGLARRSPLRTLERSCWWAIPSASRPRPSSTGCRTTIPGSAWSAAWRRRPAGPGGNRLSLGTQVRTRGAVGALLGPGAEVGTLVSQGCRPFGQPLVVTRAEHNIVYELAGRPALEQLVAQAHDSLTEDEVVLLESGGLHLGRVIDEHREHFGRGDFLVRSRGRRRSLHRRHRAWATPCAVGTTRAIPSARRRQRGRGPPRAWSPPAPPMPPWSSRATAGAPGCSAHPTTTCRSWPSTWARCPWRGSSPPASSGPVGSRNFLHGFTASVACSVSTPTRSAGTPGRRRTRTRARGRPRGGPLPPADERVRFSL